jgi:ribosome-binding factor A
MATARMRRVNEAVREVLSAQLAAGLKDPRIGFVTVTGVETSPDLRNARVFFSVLGDEAAREDALAGLRHSKGFLQSVINSELRMKRTPTLDFVYDTTGERAARLSRLIDEVAPTDPPEEDDEGV